MKLDDLLREVAPPRDAALEQARALARAELKAGKPVSAWPMQLMALGGVTLGLVVAAAGALLLSGATDVAHLASRGPVLALLVATSLAASFAAFNPRAPRAVVLGLGALAAVGLVLMRPPGEGSAPEWVCTVSHLGMGLIPLLVAVLQLRAVAPDLKRALLGGVAAGCAGAMLGELACGRGPLHVALYHLPAWALVAAAAVLIARRLTPRTFAP